jgi:uncharacterized protein (DUF427 family)
VEGNYYFAPDSINWEYLKPSEAPAVCPRKRTASYKDAEVNSRRNADAARYHPVPNPAAKEIEDYVAFWNGVRVEA